MNTFHQNGCEHSEVTCAYAAQALASSEVAAAEAHISLCPDCQRVWSGTGCTCLLVTSTKDVLL